MSTNIEKIPQYSEEQFYGELLDRCITWREEEGDQEIVRWGQKRVEWWGSAAGEHPHQQGFEAEMDVHGLAVTKSATKVLSAFMFGETIRSRHDELHLEFQFNFSIDNNFPGSNLKKDIAWLFMKSYEGLIVVSKYRYDRRNMPHLYSWANQNSIKGERLGSWSDNWPIERFLSDEGFDCHDIISINYN